MGFKNKFKENLTIEEFYQLKKQITQLVVNGEFSKAEELMLKNDRFLTTSRWNCLTKIYKKFLEN